MKAFNTGKTYFKKKCKSMLIDIIEIHSDIVSSYTVQKFKIVGPSYHLACSMLLVDGSRLFVKDYLFLDGQIKYSFHWQDKEGICIIRWDNAPHHQDVNTFPYHKHIGQSENIEESPPMNLEKVLDIIQSAITSRSA